MIISIFFCFRGIFFSFEDAQVQQNKLKEERNNKKSCFFSSYLVNIFYLSISILNYYPVKEFLDFKQQKFLFTHFCFFFVFGFGGQIWKRLEENKSGGKKERVSEDYTTDN